MTRKNNSTGGKPQKSSSKVFKNGSSSAGYLIEYFDATIYANALLKRSAKAFKELADIEIRREGKYNKVTFRSVSRDDRTVIVDEFANYALSCLVLET